VAFKCILRHSNEGFAQFGGSKRITDRESDYSRRRLNRALSPSRNDAFAMGRGAANANTTTFHTHVIILLQWSKHTAQSIRHPVRSVL
jgi:hypothetical protein